MGGRAAEVLLFEGDISTGAADDFQRATDIATEMVTLYGMAETVGQRTYKPAPQGFLSGQALDKPVASEATLREIDLSVRGIVADAFDEARAILTRRHADLDHGAELTGKGSDHRGGFSGYPADGSGREAAHRVNGPGLRQ
jgi:cell division protease FtsH